MQNIIDLTSAVQLKFKLNQFKAYPSNKAKANVSTKYIKNAKIKIRAILSNLFFITFSFYQMSNNLLLNKKQALHMHKLMILIFL